MRRSLRFLIKFVILWVGMLVIGRVASRQFEGETTPDDDEFRILGFIGGRSVHSKATALRSATVHVTVGGIDLDLRGATLDPTGAHLALKVTVGGMKVVVPASWRVYVAEDVRGGAVEINTEPPETLGDDAPVLTIEAVVRSGGVVIDAAD